MNKTMTLIPDEKCLKCPGSIFNRLSDNNGAALQIADNLILQLHDHANNIIAGSDEISEGDQEIANACSEYIILRNLTNKQSVKGCSKIQHISCDKPLSPPTADLIGKIVDEAYETK